MTEKGERTCRSYNQQPCYLRLFPHVHNDHGLVDLEIYLLRFIPEPSDTLLNIYRNVDVSQHFSEVDVVCNEDPLDRLNLPTRMVFLRAIIAFR